MLVHVNGNDLVMANNKKSDTVLHYLLLYAIIWYTNKHSKATDKIKVLLEVSDAKIV